MLEKFELHQVSCGRRNMVQCQGYTEDDESNMWKGTRPLICWCTLLGLPFFLTTGLFLQLWIFSHESHGEISRRKTPWSSAGFAVARQEGLSPDHTENAIFLDPTLTNGSLDWINNLKSTGPNTQPLLPIAITAPYSTYICVKDKSREIYVVFEWQSGQPISIHKVIWENRTWP